MHLKQIKSWIGLVIVVFVFNFILRINNPVIAQTIKAYNQISFPPLKEVKIPSYERYELPNGMVIFLMEDHRLPEIKGTAILKINSKSDPDNKIGLAKITGELLRSGGTVHHSPEQLNEILENHAAAIESSIDIDSGKVNFLSLTPDFDDMFKLFAEVLRYPRFDLVQFDILKSNLKGQIARRNDNPSNLANREFKKLIYGPYSPFARSEELQTIDNITLQDISDFYRQIGPERIILGLVGDFESNQVKLLIKKTLANWKKKENEPKKIYSENLVQYSSGKIFKVEQNHLNQNTVLIGQLGGKLDSLDYPSLSVLNGVFNGFGGRFFNEIRSRQGLAYNVYGLWKANYNYPGFFVAGGQTRATQTVPFIKAIKKEITRIIENPISADELSYAKDSILNSFVFSFSKPSLILNRLLNYEYFKYPIDFIFDYQKSVKKVNSRDIQRVAREYLHPENMVTLIVGNTNNIQPPLQVLEDQATDIQIN